MRRAWNFVKKYKNAILNVGLAAAPVVAGVLSGGVFTVATIATAAAAVVGKLSASPLDHSTTFEDALATAAQLARIELRSKSGGDVPPGP